MLAELGAVEQRYRAVLEALDEGVSVTEVARRYGGVRQTCTLGCAGMPKAGWAGWRTSLRGRRRARMRCLRRPRRGSQGCGGIIRGGSVADPMGAGAGPLSGLPGAGAPWPGGRAEAAPAAGGLLVV